jgi:hypothetical protein
MKKIIRVRHGVLLGAGALLLSTMVGVAPPAQAVNNGTIVVNVIDQYGRPVISAVEAIDPVGNQQAETGSTPGHPFVPGTTHSWSVAPGGYAFLSITPWSGIECYGVTPCDPVAPSVVVTPVVTVTSDTVSSYTLVVHVPTITGSPTAGSPLTIQIPAGLTTLHNFIPTPGGGHGITQQWLRGGSEIAGATTLSYTTVPADGGNAVAARLDPSSVQLAFPLSYGIPVGPFTTNAITLAKYVLVKTKTKFKLPHHLSAGDRISVKIKVKAANGGVPGGTVTIKVGHSTVRKTLASGSTFANLPPFKAGTYNVTVSYPGSDYFAKSKKKVKITVKP